jgi:hypothetical protein
VPRAGRAGGRSRAAALCVPRTAAPSTPSCAGRAPRRELRPRASHERGQGDARGGARPRCAEGAGSSRERRAGAGGAARRGWSGAPPRGGRGRLRHGGAETRRPREGRPRRGQIRAMAASRVVPGCRGRERARHAGAARRVVHAGPRRESEGEGCTGRQGHGSCAMAELRPHRAASNLTAREGNQVGEGRGRRGSRGSPWDEGRADGRDGSGSGRRERWGEEKETSGSGPRGEEREMCVVGQREMNRG